MFVQVMQGRVNDAARLKQQFDGWITGVGQGATGWLGATAGVAADGEFVAVVRFESEEAARANSDRPEQDAWWQETAGCFDGDVTFVDCRDVDQFGAGGSDQAGFVQVMQGRADRDKVRSLAPQMEEAIKEQRPDVIGGLIAWHGDGRFTQVVYFTSEAEARQAESAEASAEPTPEQQEMMSVFSDLTYIDLKEPWLSSP